MGVWVIVWVIVNSGVWVFFSRLTTAWELHRELDGITHRKRADDDTDIEYVYQKALEKYGSYMLTGEQIATAWQDHTLAGWDSDNPTATWGGLLGLLYGYEGLQKHFGKSDFSDDYLISRTRYNFPIAPDNFTDMASRGLEVIDDVMVNGMGGGVVNHSLTNAWLQFNGVGC